MRGKYGFLVIVLTFLSLLALFAPHQALADNLVTTAGGVSPGTVPGPPPIVTPLCPANNTLDNAARTNSTAQQQALFTAAHNVGTQFPIAAAMNQCLQNLMNVFSMMPGLSDPLGLVGGIVSQLIVGIIGQVCSQVMGVITSAQNSLLNMTKICLPMPSFGGIDLPKWNQPACSGGLQLNFLTGFAAPSSTAIYNYSQYMK